jgi:hypothetical protein
MGAARSQKEKMWWLLAGGGAKVKKELEKAFWDFWWRRIIQL